MMLRFDDSPQKQTGDCCGSQVRVPLWPQKDQRPGHEDEEAPRSARPDFLVCVCVPVEPNPIKTAFISLHFITAITAADHSGAGEGGGEGRGE